MSHINKNGTSAATIVMGFNKLSRDDSRMLLALATAFHGQRERTYAVRVGGIKDGWNSYGGVLGKVGRVFNFPDYNDARKFLDAMYELKIQPNFRICIEHPIGPAGPWGLRNSVYAH